MTMADLQKGPFYPIYQNLGKTMPQRPNHDHQCEASGKVARRDKRIGTRTGLNKRTKYQRTTMYQDNIHTAKKKKKRIG